MRETAPIELVDSIASPLEIAILATARTKKPGMPIILAPTSELRAE